MNSSGSSVEELVARSTIQDFGDFSIVTVPNWSTLTESEKIEARTKVEYESRNPSDFPERVKLTRLVSFVLERKRQITSQDDSALLSRLRDLTPPLDPEADEEESRSIEDQARKDLEREGCPPCYPTNLEFPLRDIPEKYQGVISYWKSFPGTDDVVLRAQLSDWERFRAFQRKTRRYYQHQNFNGFVEKVRERRRRHQLEGDVRLRSNPGQQSRLENWVEFQNYHIHIHERLEKEIDDLKRELNVSRKEGGRTEVADLADEADSQELLEATEWRLGRHKNLLRWIEWERMTMDAVRPPSVEGEHDDQDGALITAQESSGFDRQMRRPKARGVLGQIRVSKTEPQKGSKQGRKRKTPKAAPAIQDAGPPQSSVSLNPDSLESKPRSTNKETGLRQMRPQRVSKVKRSADASSKLPPAVPLLQAGQKRALDRARPKYQRSPQRPQPAVVKTRSGRVPRRPEKWVPDTW